MGHFLKVMNQSTTRVPSSFASTRSLAVPQDPWGQPYQYSPQASGDNPFSLYSLGADGKPGGEGQDADIGYTAGGNAPN